MSPFLLCLQTLLNTSHMFGSLIKMVNETGQSFLPHLYETDAPKLQQQVSSATQKYERVDALIKERLSLLEGAMANRCQVAENITEASDLLSSAQEDLRQISKSLGPNAIEAEVALQQYEVRLLICKGSYFIGLFVACSGGSKADQ